MYFFSILPKSLVLPSNFSTTLIVYIFITLIYVFMFFSLLS